MHVVDECISAANIFGVNFPACAVSVCAVLGWAEPSGPSWTRGLVGSFEPVGITGVPLSRCSAGTDMVRIPEHRRRKPKEAKPEKQIREGNSAEKQGCPIIEADQEVGRPTKE
jgi:hypothetical protein